MDTFCQRCLTPHCEAVIAGLQQGKDPGHISLMLRLCFGHGVTVSIPNDPAAGCRASVSCLDAGDRNTQPHLCQSDLFLPSLLLLPSALWEFSPSQKIINVHEHPPTVFLGTCVHVLPSSLFCKDSLCAWGKPAGEGVCMPARGWAWTVSEEKKTCLLLIG